MSFCPVKFCGKESLFCRGKAALSGTLEALLDGRACCLDQNNNDQHEALEGILNIDAEPRDGDNDKVDRRIGKCAENNAEHIALAARHTDACQHNRGDGVHLIALAGGSRCDIADLACLENRSDAYQHAGKDEHGNLHPCDIDACQTRTLFIGADCIDALAVLGFSGDNDQQNSYKQENKEDVRDRERPEFQLAGPELHP